MSRIERLRMVGVALALVVAPMIAVLASEAGVMVRQGAAARWMVGILPAIFGSGVFIAWWCDLVQDNTSDES